MSWKRFLKRGLDVLDRDFRRVLTFNLLYFGVMILGGLVALANPTLQTELITATGEAMRGNPVFQAYQRRDFAAALLGTFGWNLAIGAFLVLTVTGVFIPLTFYLGLERAFWVGAIYSPTTPSMLILLLFALPVLILENEAYIMAMYAGVNIGLSWLNPKWVFREEGLSRKEAFIRACRESGWVYVWISIVLFVSALLEVVTIFYILTPLAG